MDLTPRQVFRALQLGLVDEVLKSSTIWVCVQCQICSARCPLEIDIAKVMESLRRLAYAQGKSPAQKELQLFHHHFLALLERFGRSYELGLGLWQNLRSGHLFQNASLLPQLFFKGKLALLPSRIKGKEEIQAIFRRVEAREKERWPRSPQGKGTG